MGLDITHALRKIEHDVVDKNQIWCLLFEDAGNGGERTQLIANVVAIAQLEDSRADVLVASLRRCVVVAIGMR